MRNGPLKFAGVLKAYITTLDLKNGTILVQTDHNKSLYTDRQIAHDKRARELMLTLGSLSVADLKRISKTAAIKDFPVTFDDIILAKRFFGPDVDAFKLKKVQQNQSLKLLILLIFLMNSSQHKNIVELCIDTFFINHLQFLATISRISNI